MMINYAEQIRTSSMICRNHQAQLSKIGAFGAVYILTIMISNIINVICFTNFPYEFVLVKYCRGVPLSYSEIKRQKIIQAWMIKSWFYILMLLTALFSHLKIWVTKRRRHRSNFTMKRQNIATLDQTLSAFYLKVCWAILSEIYLYLIINKSQYKTYINVFNLTGDFLNCIVVPSYWLYSTKQGFKDLWSQDSLLVKKKRTTPYSPLHNISSDKEPRRP